MLRYAVRANDLELADWALSHGASPNPSSAKGWFARRAEATLYEQASSLGFSQMAELLARFGASRSEHPMDAEQRFAAAVLRHDADTARRILAEHPNVRDSHLALHQAAGVDDVDAARLALDLGISPDVENKKNGRERALHVAAWRESPRVAQLLIDRGADVDWRDRNHWATPLGFAIYGSKARTTELLSRYGTDMWNLAIVGAVDRIRMRCGALFGRIVWEEERNSPLMHLPADEDKALAIAVLPKYGADPALEHGRLHRRRTRRARGTVATLLRLEVLDQKHFDRHCLNFRPTSFSRPDFAQPNDSKRRRLPRSPRRSPRRARESHGRRRGVQRLINRRAIPRRCASRATYTLTSHEAVPAAGRNVDSDASPRRGCRHRTRKRLLLLPGALRTSRGDPIG